MKNRLFIFWFLGLWLTLLGSAVAQTTTSFGPYAYSMSGKTYQIRATFTTQPWGEANMLLSVTNTGTSSIDMAGGSEFWFTAASSPNIINYPSLGGLAYPVDTDTRITVIPRGNTNLIQAKIGFPPDDWANKSLAPNQVFSIQFTVGHTVAVSSYETIAQSIRLYANGWPRPNLYVPLAINLSGTNNQGATVNILDKTTATTTTQRVTTATGSQVNVFDGDSLYVWGSNFLVSTTLYTSTYTSQNPLKLRAGASTPSITLPYTTSVLPSGTVNVTAVGLPAGVTGKLTLTSTTYPFSQVVSIVNGTNAVASIPYGTYSVLVGRYANEAANTIAVPSYASSYSFSSSAASPLSVSFTTSTIKPFGVDGWPKYLSMGTVTLSDISNDDALSKAPLNAIFKYSGTGMGDTGVLLDDNSPTFPTTRTMQQARRLETKYASLYPNSAPPTVMPVMVHYTAQASGGGVGGIDVYPPDTLKIHYRNLIREIRKIMSYRDAAHPYPGTFILNPDLLGAQQQAYGPNNFNDDEINNRLIQVNQQLVAAYQAEGLSTASLPTFENNWKGYYQSLNFLIKTLGEGAIKFGWQENVWATGSALWVYSSANQAQAQAQSVTSFMRDKMGVFAGPWKPDFVVLDRYEADCFSVRGQNYAYNAQSWDRFVEYAATIGRLLDLPVMLWQMPGGHLVTKNETIRNYNIAEHSSAGGTYFMGDANVGTGTGNIRPDVLALPLRPINSVYNTTATNIGEWLNQVPNYDYSKSQLQKLADNNIFSILWGGGETIGVATISTNGDDDGWLANKMLTYAESGRVYQTQSSTAPTLTILSPATNSTFTAGSAIPVTVSLANATATKVEYYHGATLLGTATTAPFAYTLTNLAVGTYSITAKATTATGFITSNVVQLQVMAACTAAPTVSLAAPAVSAATPRSVTLTATASVTCGSITKVEFYNGATLLGSSTASPYTWTNVAAGTYSVTARAYANNTSTTSAVVTLTVTAASCTAAPTVSLATPVVSNSTPKSVTLTATTSVTCGSITKVEFYNGTALLGSSTASPYTVVWTNVAAGSYTLTAKSYANNTSATSTAVSLSISAPSGDICAGVAAWNPSTTYGVAGMNVTYDGHLYTSMYWTQGNQPQTPYVAGAAWKDMGTCGGCSAAPTVLLAQPGVSGVAAATVSLSATAAVSCGSITKVEFYNGTTLLGTRTASPYAYSWTNVAADTYTITAKAYANNNSTTSAPVSVTVNQNPGNICAGVAPWSSTVQYQVAGIKVTYQGRLYTSMTWTQGNAPVTLYVQGAPWKDMGACGFTGARLAPAPESETAKPFLAYPNPTEGIINVEFTVPEDKTEVRFEILDLQAKRVHLSRETFSKGKQKKVLQLTNLPPQTYVLQVTAGTDQLIGKQKFIYLK